MSLKIQHLLPKSLQGISDGLQQTLGGAAIKSVPKSLHPVVHSDPSWGGSCHKGRCNSWTTFRNSHTEMHSTFAFKSPYICKTCGISGPTPTLLNQNLHFKETPRRVICTRSSQDYQLGYTAAITRATESSGFCSEPGGPTGLQGRHPRSRAGEGTGDRCFPLFWTQPQPSSIMSVRGQD